MSKINSQNILLWHYTSLDALEKILISRKMRVTHYPYLNDKSEITIGCNFILNQLKIKKIDPQAIVTIQSALSLFQSKKSKRMFYITSFSEKEDSLYQWVAYTNHEKGGCAIGVACGANMFKERSQPMIFDKCIYSQDTFLSKIDQIIKKLCNDGDAYLAAKAFLHIIPLLKHSCFELEAEWRYVYHALDEKTVLSIDEKGRSFIERNFIDENPIKKIIISPHGPDRESSLKMIVKLVQELNLVNVEVIESELPYVGDVIKAHNP